MSLQSLHPLALGILLTAAPPAGAQEAGDATDKLGWTNEAELSYVASEGNSQTSSLGFGAKFERKRNDRRFEASFGGLRAESTNVDRSAVLGGDGTVSILEDEDSGLTAENYHAKARFDHDFRATWYWHFGGSWERDPFAGIDHRFQGIAGIGHTVRDDEHQTWRIDAGATWTGERLTVDDRKDFLGLRVLSEWSRQVTETTKLQHTFQVDENLDETEDYRIETKLSLQVAMSNRLALKVGLEARYDNEPANEELTVVDANGDAVDGLTVLVPLEETDVKGTVSLVVFF